MLSTLWLIPALPLAGFVLLALFGRRLGHAGTTAVGVGSVGLAAAVALAAALAFILSPPSGWSHTLVLWRWFTVNGLQPDIALFYDPLAVVMTLVVTGVGFLIHVFSTGYMADDDGYSRYFAYMNLFVAMMLLLVLGRSLLLLYLGWEGVGLCSYLLIGFWYRDLANGRAARKAFIVTRVGDTALTIGLFLIFLNLGTLDIPALVGLATQQWAAGTGLAIGVAALLLGGAVGKSAQLPLQTWLPDAMAGPTPVSALIHAATMVTAGVYLIARLHGLFLLAPPVMTAVAIVGAATLLLAGFSAITQRDIKRVLAYSTISQIGYMFLALGVGAWSAAVFHLMTHAFFKSLLFLGAGAIMVCCHEERDLFRLGGLRTRLPVVFWTFLVASAALSGFPLVSAGFYSKGLILSSAFASTNPLAFWLWLAGLIGVLLTAIYTFRMVFLAFYGPGETEVEHRPGANLTVPLVILAVLACGGGFVETPFFVGGIHVFGDFLRHVLPAPAETHLADGTEAALEGLASAIVLLGIFVAWWWVLRGRRTKPSPITPLVGERVHAFWFGDWGLDTLYETLLVHPWATLAQVGRGDVVDLWPRAVAWTARALSLGLRETQTGRVRWYAGGLAVGAAVALGVVLWL